MDNELASILDRIPQRRFPDPMPQQEVIDLLAQIRESVRASGQDSPDRKQRTYRRENGIGDIAINSDTPYHQEWLMKVHGSDGLPIFRSSTAAGLYVAERKVFFPRRPVVSFDQMMASAKEGRRQDPRVRGALEAMKKTYGIVPLESYDASQELRWATLKSFVNDEYLSPNQTAALFRCMPQDRVRRRPEDVVVDLNYAIALLRYQQMEKFKKVAALLQHRYAG